MEEFRVVYYKPRTSEVKVMATIVNANLESYTIAVEFPYLTRGTFKEVLARRLMKELNETAETPIIKVIIK